MTDKDKLKKIIREKSYRRGSFKLTSGKTSDFYIDGKQTTLSADGAYLCGKLFFEIIKRQPTPIDAVGGMTLGADPLVTATSIVSYLERAPIPAFIVRKESKKHGTEQFIEGKNNLPEGCSVALVEDVVVDLQFRDRGIGRKLMESIEDWSRSRGATRMQLLADRTNFSALDFYDKIGWLPTQLICLRRKWTSD